MKVRKIICIRYLIIHVNLYIQRVILCYYRHIIHHIRFYLKLSLRSILIVTHILPFIVYLPPHIKKWRKSIIHLRQMSLNKNIPKWSKYKCSNNINWIMNSCYRQHVYHVHYWNYTNCTYWSSPQCPQLKTNYCQCPCMTRIIKISCMIVRNCYWKKSWIMPHYVLRKRKFLCVLSK